MEETSAHVSLREALVNLCVHSSYGEQGNMVVKRELDKITFRNPGRMLVSPEDFYAGGHSECRNPVIQKMFTLLGYGEKAGSGYDYISKGWADNNWPKPQISEHSTPDYVLLEFDVEALINIMNQDLESQKLHQNGQRQQVKQGQTTESQGQATESQGQTTESQGLTETSQGQATESQGQKAGSQGQKAGSQGQKQGQKQGVRQGQKQGVRQGQKQGVRQGQKAKQRIDTKQITIYCSTPKSLEEITTKFGFKDKYKFKKKFLDPLMKDGNLTFTHPDNPNHREQKYVTVNHN